MAVETERDHVAQNTFAGKVLTLFHLKVLPNIGMYNTNV